MSGAIGPGDWVVCVKSYADRRGSITAGRAYLVARIDEPCGQLCGWCHKDLPAFVFAGHSAFAACPCAFGPFHGKEESVLGLSRKLPTCEPVS